MIIAIVEDNPDYLKNMKDFLTAKGHLVLAVLVTDQDANSIAAEVNAFDPLIVMLDHTLRDKYPALNGDDVARLLAIPRDRLVGISTRGGFGYCKWHFGGKEGVRGDKAENPCNNDLSEILNQASSNTPHWVTLRPDLHVRMEMCNFGGSLLSALTGGTQREGVVVEGFRSRNSERCLWDDDYGPGHKASFAQTDLTRNEQETIHKEVQSFAPQLPVWQKKE